MEVALRIKKGFLPNPKRTEGGRATWKSLEFLKCTVLIPGRNKTSAGGTSVRQSTGDKIALMQWAISPEGPPAKPFLRVFKPRAAFFARIGMSDPDRTIFLPCPPFVKIIAIRRYARVYALRSFVETGTYLGHTMSGVNDVFDQCYTLELSTELHARALALFADRRHIHCVQGDSGVALSQILQEILEPTLFWLDAHSSGGITADAGYNPIYHELDAIYSHPVRGHVILADDARGLDIERIRQNVPPGNIVSVQNDIVRIVPAS